MFDNKTKIVIALLAIIFIIILIILTTYPKFTPSINPNPPSPTMVYPTKYINIPTKIPFDSLTPTVIISPLPFTGVLKETLDVKTQSLIDKKQDLRKKTPLSETYFFINFDYAEDKFLVDLKEPKDQSRLEFETWLRTNYQAIPLDRFIIK